VEHHPLSIASAKEDQRFHREYIMPGERQARKPGGSLTIRGEDRTEGRMPRDKRDTSR